MPCSMPVASIAARAAASGSVMRMIISVPPSSASKRVSMWLSGVGSGKCIRSIECDDMLARGEDHPSQRHHAFLADRFTNDRESLLTDFAIRHDVVGIV